MRMSRGPGVLLAAAALAAVAVRQETPDERAERRKTPPPEREPTYVGIDYGREPGLSLSAEDRSRLEAAQAKRERRAQRNLATSSQDQGEKK